jgi:hypothetical protein
MEAWRRLGLIAGLLLVGFSGCSSDDGFSCGPAEKSLKCAEGELCVSKSADLPDPTYVCAKNPCGSQALDCSCAQAACGGFSCTSAKGREVACVCLVC